MLCSLLDFGRSVRCSLPALQAANEAAGKLSTEVSSFPDLIRIFQQCLPHSAASTCGQAVNTWTLSTWSLGCVQVQKHATDLRDGYIMHVLFQQVHIPSYESCDTHLAPCVIN
eukprot:573213-Amphidinium_carterae.1